VRNSEPPEVIAQLFDEFSAQIRSHFEYENSMMDSYGYFDNDAHKKEHQRLIRELDYLKEKFKRGGEMVVLQSLKEWLLNHIATLDKQIADFIRQQKHS